ncbi:MAG: 30S ribosomal protein S4 [Ignavibacteriae bacterium]|nr:30S ribosomal protein S4 [Ignavibacteriota bacterium]MCB9210017.1 30S ribosomal protein S4 [Ignavibacteriales bacterium]MCB9218598.1 30S ribosomal protein S4 [Ignavibacteriales bacterium]MCB9259396.1 30S ribosomal protein S4 [Ignavibacteriales bacterium]
MARHTGPKAKLVRKFGENIFGNPKFDKVLSNKPYGPGQHGAGRKRVSDYGTQLKEKQKLKIMYGLFERQFRNLFKKADRMRGITGENLLQLLERRLDNTVYRLGFANSRAQARQLVSHRHFTVNGKSVNIPSYTLKPGDIVAVKQQSKKMDVFHNALRIRKSNPYEWIEVEKANLSGTFVKIPERSEIPVNVNEQLIVELYSK